MSHAYYSAAWQSAMEELSAQIELENPPVQLNDNGKPLPEKSITWDDAFQHFACLYLRYLSIYRKLEDCYDQMIHPQKRQDLKFILEVVMARITQVKAQCVKFGPDGRATDYLNLENYLLDLKLGPEALEIPIPRYFKEKSDNDEANKKRDVLEKCLEVSDPRMDSCYFVMFEFQELTRCILFLSSPGARHGRWHRHR